MWVRAILPQLLGQPLVQDSSSVSRPAAGEFPEACAHLHTLQVFIAADRP